MIVHDDYDDDSDVGHNDDWCMKIVIDDENRNKDYKKESNVPIVWYIYFYWPRCSGTLVFAW